MDVNALLLLALTLLVAVAGSVRLPVYWRTGGLALEKSVRGWWPYGELMLAGWVRATPMAVVGTWGLLLGLLGMVLSRGLAALREPATVVGLAGLAMLLGSIAVAASVILFNRPRSVVPPGRRDEPGVVAGWLRGRRQR